MTTSHIQVPDIEPHVQYTANGTQTVFPFSFPVFTQDQLQVTIDQIVQTTSFSVHGTGQTTGGTITFTQPPHNGAIITIERRIPFRRLGDFSEGGEIAAATMNNELDMLMMCAQQLQFDQNSMLHFSNADQYGATTLPNKNARMNKVLGFDENGDPTVYETADTYAAPTVTQSGIGAQPRALTDKVTDSISVRDFGALGDGVADDTGAIQNAINAHSRIYIPAGTYRITESLNITSGKHLFDAGAASVLQAANDTIDIVSITGSHNTICDLQMRFGASAMRLFGSLSPCMHNRLTRLILHNQSIAIELDGYTDINNPCAYNHFQHIVIEKPKAHGVHMTRSGLGARPCGNVLYAVSVLSQDTNTTGAGFFIECARNGNSLIQCETDMAATAQACIAIGYDSDKTRLSNITTRAAGTVANITLASGSTDTALMHILTLSAGAALQDSSNGSYMTLNAGAQHKSYLNDTHIRKLTTDTHRHNTTLIALASDGTVSADITRSVHLIDATNAITTFELPKADSSNNGLSLTIKKTDSTTKAVTITESGGNGPDGRHLVLANPYDNATLLSNGSQWLILHSSVPYYTTLARSGNGNYDINIAHPMHTLNTSTGPTVVRLPSASNALSKGRMLTIKKVDNTVNTISIVELGGVGPDGGTITLTARYHYVTVLSDGTSWHIISKHN